MPEVQNNYPLGSPDKVDDLYQMRLDDPDGQGNTAIQQLCILAADTGNRETLETRRKALQTLRELGEDRLANLIEKRRSTMKDNDWTDLDGAR